ncbi:MAG: tRNA (guanosine(37)-N1)-methyltransferase TrmD [Gammaproteobacteria bacterium]
MRIDVVTLFPEMIRVQTGFGVQGRAVARGLVELVTWNPRDYTLDRHGSVDDKPYGGGPGMVMQVQPLRAAIQAAKSAGPDAPVIYLSPQGDRFTQDTARRLAGRERLVLLAGRYEGIDERLIDMEVDEEISIGDYVLSGGELPVLVVMDAITRLLPGALGDADSALEDSFMDGLLDYPHYTRPEQIENRQVPQVLLSGNHAAINRWRRKQALGRTRLRRPDLLEAMALDDDDRALLNEYFEEYDKGIAGS